MAPRPNSPFAQGEVTAPLGLWERGAEASGYIPPSARLSSNFAGSQVPAGVAHPFPRDGRAPKAPAVSPSGETRSLPVLDGARVPPNLDKHASNVSPAPQGLVGLSPPTATKSSPAWSGKAARHALRRAAGRALGSKWRVSACGQKALGSVVTLHSHNGSAHFGNIETCSSVWTCPVCAAKITEGRRVEIDALLKAHREAGGSVYMATFTIPHHKFQTCKELKWAVSQAWRKVKSGKDWVRAKAKFQWFGDVRALEITHGGNGWHPHLHVLILFNPGSNKTTEFSFGGWLFETWAHVIERLGYGVCRRAAFSFERVDADSGAADYVGKWGAALELTKAHTKQGKDGQRTPWEILRDFSGKRNSRDCALFREFAHAFKGARQLTWSRGLRQHYLTDAEPSDEQLTDEPALPQTHTASLTRQVFDCIVSAGKTAELLSALENGGLNSLFAFLNETGIRWRADTAPGIERDSYVPLITLGLPREPWPPPPSLGKGKPFSTFCNGALQ